VAIGLRTKGIWLAREKRRRKRHFAGAVAAITISFFWKRNPCNASTFVADVEKLGFVL
jgi:hypothetical protein